MKATDVVIESVAVPVPSVKQLDTVAVILGPCTSICDWGVEAKDDDAQSKEDDGTSLANCRAVLETNDGNAVGEEIVDLAESDDAKVKGGEVVMQKELSLHEEERKVVECPAENGSANLIVETLKGNVLVVVAASLPAKNSKTLEGNVESNGSRGAPPDQWVANKVDLTVVLAPEVDTTTENGPGRRARVPGVGLDEAGVGGPHDSLQLPELAKEARIAVVDLFSVFLELRVIVGLNVPDAVWEGASFSASDFLLLETPFRKFDLVGEEDAASHDVDKLELGLNGAQPLLCNSTVRQVLDNLNLEKIVGVSIETFVAVSGNLILPVSLGDGWAVVVRVNAAVGCDMVELEDGAVVDEGWIEVVPGERALDLGSGSVQRLSLVLE